MRTYKNPFTLDGRVKPRVGVSQTKVKAVQELTERHLAGDRIASAQLLEVLTTSDAIFNFAHLTNLNFLPNYDEAERNWRTVAGTRTVDDLKPVSLYSLQASWTDGDGESNVLSAHGAAPTIPEATPYPYAYIKGEVNQGAKVSKKGFKTDWTLEARINDGLRALDDLPQAMLDVALDTEEEEVWGALTGATIPNLAGGPVPTGATVAANAPFSRDAVIRAVIELSERTILGRKIGTVSGFNLVVPVGQALFVNFVLNQTLTEIQNGTTPLFVYQVNGYNPLANVTVVESEWVTGTEWYLIPKPGSTRRPVLERLSLRGFEAPQLFVENVAGLYVGGGQASPFEGSFDNDSITLKLRQFGGGVVWDGGQAIVYSEGDGN